VVVLVVVVVVELVDNCIDFTSFLAAILIND
jgi:hypothetical protein